MLPQPGQILALDVEVFSHFPFSFEGGIRDLVVSVTDHYLSFYFGIILTQLEASFVIRIIKPVLDRLFTLLEKNMTVDSLQNVSAFIENNETKLAFLSTW